MKKLKLPWKIGDLEKIEKNGRNVFSIFSCGGGSTMGYKLAGYDVIGCCEIDKEMFTIYRMNHAPKHGFNKSIQDFNVELKKSGIPDFLKDLDILDGSPPCSSFSISGSREDKWGKEKKFREGQTEQILDELFFDYIDTARMIQPKVVIAENVRGLIAGNARYYVKRIFKAFDEAGYDVQLFLLNSMFMGVPQKRERTFFIARRKDLGLSKIDFDFKETPIPFSEVKNGSEGKPLGAAHIRLWESRIPADKDLGSIAKRIDGKEKNWNHKLLHSDQVSLTIASAIRPILYDEPRHANDLEIQRIQSFPDDYNFFRTDAGYVCGMSVPPFMMARIAERIFEEWFKV